MGARGLVYANGQDAGSEAASIFSNLDLNFIDTGLHAPPGWNTWFIPTDTHPDAQAHESEAKLILEALIASGLVEPGLDQHWE